MSSEAIPEEIPETEMPASEAVVEPAVTSAVVVGGPSALGAALVRLGLPKKDVIKYERYIKEHIASVNRITACDTDRERKGGLIYGP